MYGKRSQERAIDFHWCAAIPITMRLSLHHVMISKHCTCGHTIFTITGDGKGCDVSAVKFDEDPDQCNIEDHSLHQHPHEGD